MNCGETCWMHVTCVCVFAESGGGRVCGGAVHVHASAGISRWTHQHTDHLQRPETPDTRRHQPEMCRQLLLFGQPSKVRAADTMISCFIFRSERLTLRSTMLMCVPVHGRVNCINVCEQLVLYSKWVFIFFFLSSVHCFASFASSGQVLMELCCWGWLADGLTKACKGPTGC